MQLRRRLEQRTDGDRLPAAGREESRPFFGGKLERRPGPVELTTHALFEHALDAGRSDVAYPVGEARDRGEVASKRTNVLGRKVNEQTLAQYQHPLRFAAKPGEKLPPGARVRQIQPHALEPANRFFVGEDFFFVVKDSGQVHFNPTKRGGKRHAVRPRVEAGREVDDRVRALRDLVHDVAVHDIGARNPRPSVLPAG